MDFSKLDELAKEEDELERDIKNKTERLEEVKKQAARITNAMISQSNNSSIQ